MAKVVQDLWNGLASDPAFLSSFTEQLKTKSYFSEIEFYLPQIAHLSIQYFDQPAEIKILEEMISRISLTSAHLALQLSFVYIAALEDFQPELPNGSRNPSHHPKKYALCAHLLQNVERSFVMGKDFVAAADSAESVLSRTTAYGKTYTEGMLLYKRVNRKSAFHTKPWKERYFVIAERVLLCYRSKPTTAPSGMDLAGMVGNDTTLLRAIPLQDCEVTIIKDHEKYPHYFSMHHAALNLTFQIRCDSAEKLKEWTTALNKEIKCVSFADESSIDQQPAPNMHVTVENTSSMGGVEKRYEFFQQQKNFIRKLTDICEKLRFLELPQRKKELVSDLADLALPSLCYIPLCKSTDVWKNILCVLPDEAHAFTTKARCPALVYFEVTEHPKKSDVASFLALELQGVIDGQKNNLKAPSSIWRADVTENASNAPHHILHGNSEAVLCSSVASDSAATPIEKFEDKSNRLQKKSQHRSYYTASGEVSTDAIGWQLDGLLAKSNDDLRQEVFVMQCISFFHRIFQAASIPVWMMPYHIMSTAKTCGLIQLLPNAISFDGLKKSSCYGTSLSTYFQSYYGSAVDSKGTKCVTGTSAPVAGGATEGLQDVVLDATAAPKAPSSEQPLPSTGKSSAYDKAVNNFVESMAAYSIVTYLLAIKDRHNGNVMLDIEGHVIHIDFGFVFGLAPGKAFSMEKAPWKLTVEMVELMGGLNGAAFVHYKKLCCDCLLEARKHVDEIIVMIEVMTFHSQYPAFKYNANAKTECRNRFLLDVPDDKIPDAVEALINKSYNHMGTGLYDDFQVLTNGIAK